MGTREVYEEKLRTGNLHHDPTIKPGLGSARCPRCLSLLNPSSENSEWEITPVLHDATAVVGSGLGGMLSAVHAFNTGIPYVQKHVKGPKWLPFLIGLPPLLMLSTASAAFGGTLKRPTSPELNIKNLDDQLLVHKIFFICFSCVMNSTCNWKKHVNLAYLCMPFLLNSESISYQRCLWQVLQHFTGYYMKDTKRLFD
ncbi:uncharacterized protein LOC111399491 isoform X3 [Olea europaea var. sylvestris]|uniref:uncharacterized protein LOC111399491 isoform X1 n=1 Tax=Olea europaea var. sylvestris TaxID=158386 RepID=UPI000C1D367F|nr:uncharacterized protein LOC111399491 isoform X1 [Olea europaea var. sylvestris]XP_022882603.1 uncharacterized protein LOC111399491 isoform X2 [Olea europaea var. sylvestris]XP_022882604.1 uncharacterized protein LOC111399491 isoform X3 [Olea europaea var. sylvestris]